MENRYIPGVAIPSYDESVTEAIERLADERPEFGGGVPDVPAGLENRDGEIYRVIYAESIGELHSLDHAICDLGFRNLLADSGPSRDGLMSRYRPDLSLIHI